MKKYIYTFLFTLSLQLAYASDEQSGLIGIYSNRAEGFYVQTIFLSKDSRGLYGGRPVEWRYEPKTNKIYVKGNLGENLKITEIEFTYLPETKVIKPKEESYPPGTSELKFIQKDIPAKIQQSLDKFDWDFKKLEIH
jgi:hypothetical protein